MARPPRRRKNRGGNKGNNRGNNRAARRRGGNQAGRGGGMRSVWVGQHHGYRKSEADNVDMGRRDDYRLIPRKEFFGTPGLRSLRMSPDGQHISFIAPTQGIENVCVAPTLDPQGALSATWVQPIESILAHFWTYNPRYILYLTSVLDDENWRLCVTDIEGIKKNDPNRSRILTPEEGVQARMLLKTPRRPDEVLVGINDRDPKYHDVHRINFVTGESELHFKNDIGAIDFVFDHDFNTRFARVLNPDASMSVLAPDGDGGWESFMEIPSEDTLSTYFIHFDITGRYAYMRDSRGRNTAALTEIDTETGNERILADDQLADMSDFTYEPSTGIPQGVAFEYERYRWEAVDRKLRRDFNVLFTFEERHPKIIDRSLDDTRWIVEYNYADGPEKFYLYDREEVSLRLLSPSYPHRLFLDLAPMHSTTIRSRDGLEMVAYYTLPRWERGRRPSKPLPTVLNVHGGPWARDQWGYDDFHQVLANRGYAVISVNFRGSSGFGKDFLNAGNREWAGKMHEDLLDAVDWAVRNKITDRDKVAIMGASYGGYAALVGLSFTPDVFACGIDMFGPTDLSKFWESMPSYWQVSEDIFKTRVGDYATEEGREFLWSRSPLSRVGDVTKPLIVVQGGNDPRVDRSEADRIVDAMKARGIPVIYILFPAVGHALVGGAGMRGMISVMEVFLQQHMGGRAEPIGEDAFIGSGLRILDGAEQIPGAEAAIEAQQKHEEKKIMELMKKGGVKRLLPERVRRGRLF